MIGHASLAAGPALGFQLVDRIDDPLSDAGVAAA